MSMRADALDLLRRAYEAMAGDVEDTGHTAREGRRNMMMADTALGNAAVRGFLRESPAAAAAAAADARADVRCP